MLATGNATGKTLLQCEKNEKSRRLAVATTITNIKTQYTMFSKIGFLVEKLLNCGGGVKEIPKTLSFLASIWFVPVCKLGLCKSTGTVSKKILIFVIQKCDSYHL